MSSTIAPPFLADGIDLGPQASRANAEQTLIGTAILYPRDLPDVEDLDPGDFEDIRLGALWRVLCAMSHTREPINLPTVVEALPRIPQAERNGLDQESLADLVHIAQYGRIGYYATLVQAAAARRRLRIAAGRIAQMADAGLDPAVIVETARGEIDRAHTSTADVAVVQDRIGATITEWDQPTRTNPTPWPTLNAIIGGWRPGALYVIGARPGVGKTLAAVEAAIGLAATGPVAFSSLEMPEAELHARLVANLAHVSVARIDRRELTENDHRKINDARHRLALPISIDDRGLVTTTDIRSHARSLARRHGHLAGIIVDYLQLMTGPRGDRRPRHEVVASFSRDLKLLAKDLDCPVIALSQLNRGSTERADARPRLSDLRESGAVEQDSDVVLLLHEDEDDETHLSVHVAKNRHGARGDANLIRRGWYSQLTEHTWS